MKTQIQKGFTLIELLVVIAIIGILATLLFMVINPADKVNKADDAAKKRAFAGFHNQATIIYKDDGFVYSNICTDPTITPVINWLSATCANTATKYGVAVEITGNNSGDPDYFCIDSTGFAGVVADQATNPIVANSDLTCN